MCWYLYYWYNFVGMPSMPAALPILPRDAMIARSLLSCGVRPSLCPSVTLVYCVETAKTYHQTFSSPCGPIILVFPEETRL